MKVKCSHCQVMGEISRMVKYSKAKEGSAQYYHCRPCNRKRAAAYYKTKKGKQSIKKAIRKSEKKYPRKCKARFLLNEAVRKGIVIKPKKCSACKKSVKSRLLQGHHHNYNKPLFVTWLCASCHADEERATL